MHLAASSRIPTSRRLLVAVATALLLLAITLSTGSAKEAADQGGSSATSPVVVVSTSEAAVSTPVTTDVRDAPDEEDVVLVLGYTAATVLGLAGLALLDRKPEPVDREPVED